MSKRRAITRKEARRAAYGIREDARREQRREYKAEAEAKREAALLPDPNAAAVAFGESLIEELERDAVRAREQQDYYLACEHNRIIRFIRNRIEGRAATRREAFEEALTNGQ